MLFTESFTMALSSLLANRLRALLTTLGIIIGIGSVIGLISLGRGVEDFISSEFEDLGSNLIVVFSSSPTSSTRDRIQRISTIETEAIRQLPSIARVAPIHG
ncbi:MAG: ABC transporter permease, partial [Chloroflexota bacterium]